MITGIWLWLLFIEVQVLWHWYLIVKKKRSPNHVFHALLRLFFAFGMSYELVSGWINRGIYISMLGIVFWCLFDCQLNLMRGRKLTYLGDTAKTDIFFKHVFGEATTFFLKLVLLTMCGSLIFNI